MSFSSDFRSFGALLLAAMIIGLVPIFVRLTGLDPSAAAFWRMFLSIPLIAIVFLSRPNNTQKNSTGFSAISIAMVGVYFGLDLIFLHMSLAYTSVAMASLLNNLAPVFVGIIAVFTGARLSGRYWLGLLIALLGVLILMGPKLQTSEGMPVGEVAGLVSAFFFALYIRELEKARKFAGTWQILLWSGIAASLTLAPIAFLFEVSVVPVTLANWMAILGLATVCQLFGQACLVYAAAHLPGVLVSNGMLSQTVFAAVFAFLFFDETLDAIQAVGALVALCGISIVLSRRSRSVHGTEAR